MKIPSPIRALARCLCLAGCWLDFPALAGEVYIEEDDFFSEQALEQSTSSIPDPLKGFNKAVFKFNDFVYIKIWKHVSRGYRNVMPDPAERGLGNFFGNLKYPVRLAGSLLQFKFKRAGQETARFALNTTIGLGGFMDPARDFKGLNPPREDIGQAFGNWGVGHGFYLVLPLLGPTSMRDAMGGLGDRTVHPVSRPWSQVDKTEYRLGLLSLRGVNDSPDLLNAYESLTESAIDPYQAVKDLYTQRRAADVRE